MVHDVEQMEKSFADLTADKNSHPRPSSMSACGTLATCARRGSVSGLETFSDIGASAAHVAE